MKRINFAICIFLCAFNYIVAQNSTTIIDSILSGNIQRTYRLYVPKNYDPLKSSALIIDMHGYSSNAIQEQAYSNFMPIADTANFFVVYPNGTVYNGMQFWNAGLSPGLVNDVAFISDLIEHIRSQFSIDANRVYACGMSNGGFMSHTLACALSNKIAAIASVTGSMFTTQYSTCVPNRVVPVMQIHGTADNTVPYTGNTSMIAVDTLMKYWIRNDKCSTLPEITDVPNINLADSCTAIRYLYKDGELGAACELYKIVGGGHSWPGSSFKIAVTNQDFNASEKIWLFFRRYRLDKLAGLSEERPIAKVNMYPNPCMDYLNVEYENAVSVSIVDLTGKEIIRTNNQKQINVSALVKGVYSVVIISRDKQRLVKKLVKL
jgi:polyhydroxybutyrate depolymerase